MLGFKWMRKKLADWSVPFAGDAADLSDPDDDEEDLTDFIPEEDDEEENAFYEWRSGCVTREEDGYFLVDGNFYWPKTLPLGDPRFRSHSDEVKVGRKVRVKLKRLGEHEEWRVVEVRDDEDELEDVWQEKKLPWWFEKAGSVNVKEEEGSGQQQSLLVVVDQVRLPQVAMLPVDMVETFMGTSEKRLECDWGRVGLDYVPWKGDFLTLQIGLDPKGKTTIYMARPLRYDEGSGEITSWNARDMIGVVREDVFFSVDACTSSYNPRRGDSVRYHAVECQPNSYNFQSIWRAIRVVPKGNFLRQKTVNLKELVERFPNQFMVDLLASKHGIQIATVCLLPFLMDEERVISVSVRNVSEVDASLNSVRLCGEGHRTRSFLNSVTVVTILPVIIGRQSEVLVQLNCKASLLGQCKEVLIFDFEDSFQIGTVLDFKVGDDALKGITPKGFSAPTFSFSSDRAETFVIPGQKPALKRSSAFLPTRLPHFEVPKSMHQDLLDRDCCSLLDNYPTLGEPLVYRNYTSKFSALLHLEEVAYCQRMKQYNMSGVIFEVKGNYLSLEVPGLCEKRPSLMLGDSVIATPRASKSKFSYEGCINEVRSKCVLLNFESTMQNTYCGEVYDVEFKSNRGQFRRMHQSVDVAKSYLGENVLFPFQVKILQPQVELVKDESQLLCQRVFDFRQFPCEGKRIPVGSRQVQDLQLGNNCASTKWTLPIMPLRAPLTESYVNPMSTTYNGFKFPFKMDIDSSVPPYVPKHVKKKSCIKWVNRTLNPEQKRAVTRIVLGEARPLPYVIYGPPGTGKTVTLVETVLQIYKLRPDSRILVATPSNSSADLILQRLHNSKQIQRAQMARLNAFQRNVDVIPEELQPYCFLNKDVEILRGIIRHRIIITTCTTAGGLYKLNFRRGHFTHCFLDEAGCTTEPEALIPLGLVASGNAQIVLAGDPKQLGPVLQSSFAKLYGLEQSLLERLCESKLYRRDEKAFRGHGGYDPLLVTKLVKNYRSHQSIIEIPSKLFYHNDLEVCAPQQRRDRFLQLPFLPNANHPVIFHGVRGMNYQEDDSPSWFNPVEALQVVSYVRLLYENDVEPEDIGVVAPYRKQGEKINALMDSFNLSRVKLGTVEEFQGQERPVIIITTVRSSVTENSVEFDVIHGLGFMQSEKRMNVALTRAQSLLIVVGDPHLLIADESWKCFLEFCFAKECYVGCDLPFILTNQG